jgi:hypothetical protein
VREIIVVRDGPAVVKDDVQTLTKVPPRSTSPVRITVTAWQYGRAAEPKVKTADSITWIIWLKE